MISALPKSVMFNKFLRVSASAALIYFFMGNFILEMKLHLLNNQLF